jgi:hypothetical protein
MEPDSIYLLPHNRKGAGEFLNSPLWSDLKKCLLARRPLAADAGDETHVAAAKGHQRNGYEKCIDEMEKLAFEFPAEDVDPFKRPALTITQD